MKENSQNIENANKHNDQQKNAAKMKKEVELAAKRFCRICKHIIAPIFQCSCLGGSSVSSSDLNEEKSALTNDTTGTAQKTIMPDHPIFAFQAVDHHPDITQNALTLRSIMTVLMLIADLVKNKLLTIEDNKGLCTLIIKCDPEKLTELQRNAVTAYIEMLKKELNDFLKEQGVSEKSCIVKDVKDAQGYILSFSFNIPNSKLYNKFIETLQQKKLLPVDTIAPQNTQESNNQNRRLLNPFRTALKP